ncbi:hypothetical protein KY362_07870 [Candidatus Woesearchaeota archaeon]|nr:hypothetical protein [Candidatus Woesearchaeota archaeon]
MNKRGQITVAIIIGIILLFGAGIFFYVRSLSVEQMETEVEELPALNLAGITTYVESCIIRESPAPIKLMAERGGTLTPVNYKTYNHVNYSYLCTDQPNYAKCVPIIRTRQDMELELAEYLKPLLNDCIDLDRFREQGTEVEAGDLKVDVDIAQENVVVTLSYPMSLFLGESSLDLADFTQRIDLPLGKLFDLSVNIMNDEIANGYYDQDEWMFMHGSEVTIDKHRPYPDIVYTLKKSNREGDEIVFNFALKGKETVRDVGLETPALSEGGCCHNNYDTTCYTNAIEAECLAKRDTYFDTTTEQCNCAGASRFSDPLCGDGECAGCDATWDYNTQDYTGPARVHGESWCVHDGPVGNGVDYVGTRHYKHSCFDGVEYVEECRDYREEMCAELSIEGDYPRSKAVCRPNRWQTCTMQTNQEDCEDESIRDCTWTEELVNEEQPSYGIQRTDRRCHPNVPAGFRHWEFNGFQACIAANEWRHCDGLNCPDGWVNALSQYCNFMGDCGNYRNAADRVTRSGYLNSDNAENSATYFSNGLISRGNLYKVRARLDTREQPFLTGNEFDNPGHNPQEMLDAANEYLEEVQTWTPDDFLWDFLEDGEIDIYVIGAGICGPWQAPADYRDCDVCNRYEDKPCTEYKCKSLGISCTYQEEDGVGQCLSSYATDNTAPTIEFVPDKLTSGYRAADITFFDYEGFEITPNVRLNEDFTFFARTDEEAVCAALPVPAASGAGDPSAFIGVAVSAGAASYTTEHNITLYPLAVEEVYERITDVTEMIGIGSMEDLAGMVENYRDTLEEFGEEYDLDLSTQIQALDEAAENANLELIQQALDDVTERRYRLFMSCVDRAGNINEETFFVQITLDPKGDDTTPPEVVNITPEEGSILADEAAQVNISVSELTTCRYDYADLPYEDCAYEFRCPPSMYAMSPDRTYLCTGDLDITGFAPYGRIPLFIKCRDNPYMFDTYAVKLTTGETFEVLDTSELVRARILLIPDSEIIITRPNVLKGNLKEIQANQPRVTFALNVTEAVCRYSNSEETIFEKMTEMICTDEGCVQELPVNNEVYYIKCHDSDDPARLEGSATATYEKGW